MSLAYEEVLKGFLNLSPEEQQRLIETARERLSADMNNAMSNNTELDDEIRTLLDQLGHHPKSGAEIAASGALGGWADKGIVDSVAWLENVRRKRREKFG